MIGGTGYDAPGSILTIDKAVLQNTLEQTVLALGTHFLFSYTFPEMSTALLPIMLTLFFVGRPFFIAGYKHGAHGRALGFGLTFYPTVMTLIDTLVYLLLF